MTAGEERWAEAATIMRRHGAGACLWVAERIGALALAGDMAGVERFRAIAARMERILASGRPS